jgi:hypothetical protein
MAIPSELPYEIVLRADDPKDIDAEELANFIRDLVFLHDRVWLINSEDQTQYRLDASFFYTRNGRPIPSGQRLKLASIRKESPLEMGMIVAAAVGSPAAAWAFFQILRGVLLLRGERRIQSLQEQKLRQEVAQAKAPNHQSLVESRVPLITIYNEELGGQRKSSERIETELRLLQRDVQRISENNFRITEIEVKRTIQHQQPDANRTEDDKLTP